MDDMQDAQQVLLAGDEDFLLEGLAPECRVVGQGQLE